MEAWPATSKGRSKDEGKTEEGEEQECEELRNLQHKDEIDAKEKKRKIGEQLRHRHVLTSSYITSSILAVSAFNDLNTEVTTVTAIMGAICYPPAKISCKGILTTHAVANRPLWNISADLNHAIKEQNPHCFRYANDFNRKLRVTPTPRKHMKQGNKQFRKLLLTCTGSSSFDLNVNRSLPSSPSSKSYKIRSRT